MYKAFDFFIGIDTWSSGHPIDNDRFYKALDKVVWLDEFSPDEMADYLREKVGLQYEDRESYFAKAIQRLQSVAWAVRNFIRATNTVRTKRAA